MHSYLFLSDENNPKLEEKLKEITRKEKAERLEFSIKYIKEVLELKKNIKLINSKKRAIVIRGIDKASLPATNAMLKLLEEPPPKTFFLLTANNISNVLPTVRSRCQIIKIKNKPNLTISEAEEIENFLNMKMGRKLLLIDKITTRERAINFLKNLITYIEIKRKNQPNHLANAKIIELAKNALIAIGSNGNIRLQLTKIVVNL